MPRGKSEKLSGKVSSSQQLRKAQARDEWAGFVPCELGADDEEKFREWVADNDPGMWSHLEDCLSVGLKFSLTYDAANQCFVASLSGRPDVEGKQAWNAVLTGRGGLSGEALAIVLYKHFDLLSGDWWGALNKPKTNKRAWG